jgi:hypothetical protein
MPSIDLVVGDHERTPEHKIDRPSLEGARMHMRDEVFPRQRFGWKDRREMSSDYAAIQQVVIASKRPNPSQVLNPNLWITKNDKGHRLIIKSPQLLPATDREGTMDDGRSRSGRPELATSLAPNSVPILARPHRSPGTTAVRPRGRSGCAERRGPNRIGVVRARTQAHVRDQPGALRQRPHWSPSSRATDGLRPRGGIACPRRPTVRPRWTRSRSRTDRDRLALILVPFLAKPHTGRAPPRPGTRRCSSWVFSSNGASRFSSCHVQRANPLPLLPKARAVVGRVVG